MNTTKQDMKKILLITPFTPDNQGRGVSPTSLFLAEVSKTCKVDLVYFRYCTGDVTYEPINDNIRVIKEVLVNNWFKIKGLISRPYLFPIFTPRYNCKIAKFLKQQVTEVKYDFIYFDFSQTFSYALDIDHPKKVFMSHDVMWQRFSRERTYCRPWVRLSEDQLLHHADAIFTFSKKDCLIIEELYGLKSNNTNFFLKEMVINALPTKKENFFVFFGAWKRPDNFEALDWFLNNVADKIKGKYHFKIIGGGLSSSLKNKLSYYPDFEYLGFVNNPYPIIANAIAEIAPLHYGAGVKVKCVEALACGTPVIGTEIAFEGIETPVSNSLLLADSPAEYINYMSQINETVTDKQENKKKFLDSYNRSAIMEYISAN